MLTLIGVRSADDLAVFEEELFEGTVEQAEAHWLQRMATLRLVFGQILRRDGRVARNLSILGDCRA